VFLQRSDDMPYILVMESELTCKEREGKGSE
jgi:hypothetical protein